MHNNDLQFNCTPELPQNCKDFQGFNLEQLDRVCSHFKISGFIFDCEVDVIGKLAPQDVSVGKVNLLLTALG